MSGESVLLQTTIWGRTRCLVIRGCSTLARVLLIALLYSLFGAPRIELYESSQHFYICSYSVTHVNHSNTNYSMILMVVLDRIMDIVFISAK